MLLVALSSFQIFELLVIFAFSWNLLFTQFVQLETGHFWFL